MLSDKRYGLSVNIMATRVMPSLLPQTVNPSLNLEQFTILIEVWGEHSLLCISFNHFTSISLSPSPPPGVARNAGPHRPPATEQTETGQLVDTFAPASTVAPSVLLRQYARTPVQYTESTNRPAEDQFRGRYGPEEFHRVGYNGWLVVRRFPVVAGQQLPPCWQCIPQSTVVR